MKHSSHRTASYGHYVEHVRKETFRKMEEFDV